MLAIKRPVFIIIGILVSALPLTAEDNLANLAQRFSREIPVQLFEGQEARVGVRGEAVLECYRGIKLSEIYYFTSAITIKYRDNGLELSDEDGVITIGLTEVRCKPRHESSRVIFNKRAYRGFIRVLFQDTPSALVLINMVDIEDYLKGVLPGEIGDRTPEEYEAVKAQAIAARTYAIWKLTDLSTSRKLVPTVADQLYTGLDNEKEFLSNGIDDTEGQIMIFKNLPIAAYYHAVCGGQTAPVEKIWPEKEPQSYLAGANDNDYCTWAKSYAWEENFTLTRLKEGFGKYFVSRGMATLESFSDILDIDFASSHVTGRVESMIIYTASGAFRETDDRIRWALGRPSVPGAILPSTHFHAEKTYSDGLFAGIKIIGTGNGHGVGMCQCGAIGMSRLGYKHEDILKHYYRHIRIARLY